MKQVLLLFAVLLGSLSIAYGQNSISTKEVAQLCLEKVIEDYAGSLPSRRGAVRTDSVRIEKSKLSYFITITDFETYQVYKQNIEQLKDKNQFKTVASQNAFLYFLLVDTGKSIEYNYSSPARTSNFQVQITCDDLKEILGYDITDESRYKMALSFSGAIGENISFNGKRMEFRQKFDLASTDSNETIDKAFYHDIMENSFLHNEPGSLVYLLCMYAKLDFYGIIELKDKTVEVLMQNKDIVKAYEDAIKYKHYLSTLPPPPPPPSPEN